MPTFKTPCKILLLLFILGSVAHAENPSDYTTLNIGEKVKVIKRDSAFNTRIYIFTDASSCVVCNNSIPSYYRKLSPKKVEFVVFINGATQEEAAQTAKQIDLPCKVIGDENEVYKAFYKVKLLPFIMILNNEGIVLDMGKLAGQRISSTRMIELTDSVIAHQPQRSEKQEMTCIQRTPVLDKGQPLSSGNKRDVLVSSTGETYYLRQGCTLYEIDDKGSIRKKTSPKTDSSYRCYFAHNMTWAKQDSLICFYDSDTQPYQYCQYYDIAHNSFSPAYSIDCPDENGKSFKLGFVSLYLPYSQSAMIHKRFSEHNNRYLTTKDTLLYEISRDGKRMHAFDLPDSIYRQYILSGYTQVFCATEWTNTLFSLQQFSNIIKVWNKNRELIKKIPLHYGSQYRISAFDMKEDLNTKTAIVDVWNNISQILYFLYDNKQEHYLVCYRNETYPPGVNDPTSSDVQTDIFVNISDAQGNRLTKDDLKFSGTFLPYRFEGNRIYGTELRGKSLELVVYEYTPQKK